MNQTYFNPNQLSKFGTIEIVTQDATYRGTYLELLYIWTLGDPTKTQAFLDRLKELHRNGQVKLYTGELSKCLPDRFELLDDSLKSLIEESKVKRVYANYEYRNKYYFEKLNKVIRNEVRKFNSAEDVKDVIGRRDYDTAVLRNSLRRIKEYVYSLEQYINDLFI